MLESIEHLFDEEELRVLNGDVMSQDIGDGSASRHR